MRKAAEELAARGAHSVLIKGGHLQQDTIVDVFFDGREFTTFRKQKIETTSTHGTGCTLSAAIAAGLALGHPLKVAIDSALDFVTQAIREAPGLGSGNGPLSHFIRVDGSR
jgi:hydroxymethylpyrimidine/phosphomethylpyrimidine kinase